MKITRRQLRRIIREAMLNEALPPHLQKHFRKDGSSIHQPEWEDVTPAGYGPEDDPDYEDRFDDDQKDMDYYLAVALEKALTENPGIAGLDLVSLVKQDHLFDGLTQEDIFNTLDELVDEGTAYFDAEEDAWYYAPSMRG